MKSPSYVAYQVLKTTSSPTQGLSYFPSFFVLTWVQPFLRLQPHILFHFLYQLLIPYGVSISSVP